MRYTDAFLATLLPEIANILRTGAPNMGSVPFHLEPGVNGALEGYGFVFPASTPASRTTQLPAVSGTAIERLLRVRLVGGLTAGSTAGLFGFASERTMCASTGFVARWVTAGALPLAANRGGDLLGEAFAADGSFEPHRVVGGMGWVKASGAASTWRWYNGTPGTTVACTGTAPADARLYDHVIAVAAGSTTGVAVLIDLTDESNPVIADQRTFTVPSPGNAKSAELNRSDIASGTSPGPAVELNVVVFEGSLGVPSLLA